MGYQNPQNPARFARRNVDFTRVFKLFASKRGPKTLKKPARFARRNVDFLWFSSNSAPKRVPQNRKKKGALRAPDSAGRGAQPAMSGVDSGRKKFFLSSINLARGQKKQNCFFFHQPGPSSQKNFLEPLQNQQRFFSFINLARWRKKNFSPKELLAETPCIQVSNTRGGTTGSTLIKP